MKTSKIGKLPVNSQIFIDYSKDPPSIDFGYPDPDTTIVRKSDVTYLISIAIALLMVMVLYSCYLVYVQPIYYPNTSGYTTTINQVTVTNWEYWDAEQKKYNGTHYGFDELFINYTWNNKTYIDTFELSNEGWGIAIVPYIKEDIPLKKTLKTLIDPLILIVLCVVLMILNSFWVAKIFKSTKWGNRKYPVFNKLLSDARFSAEFTPEMVPANNIVEIPLFKNIYMDYEATDDFSEHLQKISIVEHPFNRLIKKGKKIEKKVNVYLWKVIFEFKDKPNTGFLKIKWT